MDQCENGRARADSDGERENNEGREGRLTPNQPERSARVWKDIRHPVECNICYTIFEIYVSAEFGLRVARCSGSQHDWLTCRWAVESGRPAGSAGNSSVRRDASRP